MAKGCGCLQGRAPPAGIFTALCIDCTNKDAPRRRRFCKPATTQGGIINKALVALTKKGETQIRIAAPNRYTAFDVWLAEPVA